MPLLVADLGITHMEGLQAILFLHIIHLGETSTWKIFLVGQVDFLIRLMFSVLFLVELVQEVNEDKLNHITL